MLIYTVAGQLVQYLTVTNKTNFSRSKYIEPFITEAELPAYLEKIRGWEDDGKWKKKCIILLKSISQSQKVMDGTFKQIDEQEANLRKTAESIQKMQADNLNKPTEDTKQYVQSGVLPSDEPEYAKIEVLKQDQRNEMISKQEDVKAKMKQNAIAAVDNHMAFIDIMMEELPDKLDEMKEIQANANDIRGTYISLVMEVAQLQKDIVSLRDRIKYETTIRTVKKRVKNVNFEGFTQEASKYVQYIPSSILPSPTEIPVISGSKSIMARAIRVGTNKQILGNFEYQVTASGEEDNKSVVNEVVDIKIQNYAMPQQQSLLFAKMAAEAEYETNTAPSYPSYYNPKDPESVRKVTDKIKLTQTIGKPAPVQIQQQQEKLEKPKQPEWIEIEEQVPIDVKLVNSLYEELNKKMSLLQSKINISEALKIYIKDCEEIIKLTGTAVYVLQPAIIQLRPQVQARVDRFKQYLQQL